MQDGTKADKSHRFCQPSNLFKALSLCLSNFLIFQRHMQCEEECSCSDFSGALSACKLGARSSWDSWEGDGWGHIFSQFLVLAQNWRVPQSTIFSAQKIDKDRQVNLQVATVKSFSGQFQGDPSKADEGGTPTAGSGTLLLKRLGWHIRMEVEGLGPYGPLEESECNLFATRICRSLSISVGGSAVEALEPRTNRLRWNITQNTVTR